MTLAHGCTGLGALLLVELAVLVRIKLGEQLFPLFRGRPPATGTTGSLAYLLLELGLFRLVQFTVAIGVKFLQHLLPSILSTSSIGSTFFLTVFRLGG